MTREDIIKLALEALDDLARYADTCELFLKETHPGKADALRGRVSNSIKAITAIKQARSAPVQKPYRPLQDNGSQYFGDSWDTPPAQPAPVQEPVAWTLLLVGEHHGIIGKAGDKFLSHPKHYRRVDVYTTPPTQEFVCSTGLCHYKATSDERLMLEDAVLAEREACAKVCDQFIDEMQKVLPVEKLRETDPYKAFYKANAARIIQDTIRARGQA